MIKNILSKKFLTLILIFLIIIVIVILFLKHNKRENFYDPSSTVITVDKALDDFKTIAENSTSFDSLKLNFDDYIIYLTRNLNFENSNLLEVQERGSELKTCTDH